jgi:thioredoxin 1
MTQPIAVNGSTFDAEVLESDLPVLVDVFSAGCAPCKAAAPVVAELAAQFAGQLKVVTIDGGEAPELLATLGVRGFPTFVGVRSGTVVAREAGFGGRRRLEALAEALLAP